MAKKRYDELTGSLEQKRAARQAVERLREMIEGRRSLVEYAPPSVETDFWCQRCKRDVTTIGMKEVRIMNGTPFFAFYRGTCPKGHWVIRRITDLEDDPYFHQSAFVKRIRVERGDDLIQPDHPYFKFVFPLQWEKLEKQKNSLPTSVDLWT